MKDQVVTFAQQSQFDKLNNVVPADQLNTVFGAIQQGFVDALHNTFLFGAMTCLVAAIVATLIRNPKPRLVSENAPASMETASSVAD